MGAGLTGGPLTGGPAAAPSLLPGAAGTDLTLSDFLSLASGTAPLPSLRYAAEPTTGLYLKAAGQPALSVGGSLAAFWTLGAGITTMFGPGNPAVQLSASLARIKTLVNSITIDGNDVTFASGTTLATWNVTSGLVGLRGTDSSGTPGAATIDKPSGKSAIAAGQASVVITNALVTAASRVIFSPETRDATCKELIAVPGAGSFTVSGSAVATATLVFSWEVTNII